MPLHEIEKQIHIESMMNESWNLYETIAGVRFGKSMPPKYALEIYPKAAGLAGVCWQYNGKIWINSAYYHGCVESKIKVTEICAHEIAHYLQWVWYPKAKQAHGVEFRQIMQAIGYAGDTYHTMDVSKAKAASKSSKQVKLVSLF